MLYATPKDKVLSLLRSQANIAFTINDIENESEFSEKTIRKYLEELVREKKLQAKTEAGTIYYVYEDTGSLFTGEVAPLRAMDMVTEIASKYAYLRDINRIGLETINDYLTTLDTRDAFDAYLSDIDTQILRLARSGRGPDDRQRLDGLIKLDYVMKNGLEIPKLPVICDCPAYQFDDGHPMKIVGTDASTKLEEFQVNFGFPVYVNVAFSVGAGVMAEYPRTKESREPEKFLMPRYIRTAAEEYMEDMTPTIRNDEEGGLGPAQIMGAIFSLENVVHAKVNEDAIVRWSPDVLYKDGPILPSHMDYLDFWDPRRAIYSRRAMSKVLAVKSFASANQVSLFGVVKNSRKTLLSRVIDYALSEKYPDWKRDQVGMDAHLFSAVLKPGQCTPTIMEKPYFNYVFDDRVRPEGTRLVNKDEIVKKLGENPSKAYFQQLEDLAFRWSYLKDRLDGFNRFEFFSDNMLGRPLDKHLELGLGIGNSLSHEILMTEFGRDIVPHKGSETLPEPTAKAHTESGIWRRSVADSLKMEFMRVFRSLYGSGGVVG